MDTYNILQEQLNTIANSVNNGFSKLQDDIRQIARRVDQIESNAHGVNDQIETIRQSCELLPKIYNNQLATVEAFLVGDQHRMRRLTSMVHRDNENVSYPDAASPFHNNNAPTGLSLNPSLAQGENVNQNKTNDPTSQANGRISNSVNAHGGTNDAGNGALGINPSNSVNNPNPLHQQDNSQHQIMNNRVNNNPLGMNLMTQNNQMARRGNNSSIPQMRGFTSMIPTMENDQAVMPITPQPHTAATQDDANSILNDVQGADDEGSRRLWESVSFARLNPNPKVVQEVLDEYYFGYQGQPPLKYLEEHRKEWRKGNKNLSKTFCRRYRIITAVETGTRLYMNDYGLSESHARERTITELENLRSKTKGRKETMYWLFHHIPAHLKRR